jgi:hypothetical protein
MTHHINVGTPGESNVSVEIRQNGARSVRRAAAPVVGDGDGLRTTGGLREDVLCSLILSRRYPILSKMSIQERSTTVS